MACSGGPTRAYSPHRFPEGWGESEAAPEDIRAIAPQYRGRVWNTVPLPENHFRPGPPWWRKPDWNTRHGKVRVLAVTWAIGAGEKDSTPKGDFGSKSSNPDDIGTWLGGRR